MKLRVFLDTGVFIYAFEFPQCNSNKIIDFLNKGYIEAVISERVLNEVQTYFKKFYNKKELSNIQIEEIISLLGKGRALPNDYKGKIIKQQRRRYSVLR